MQRKFATPRSGTSRRAFLAAGAALTGLAATGIGTRPARAQSRGGTIRVAKGHGQTNDTLDPGTFINGFTVALSYGIHGFLTGVATDGSVEAGVAESWEADDTATV